MVIKERILKRLFDIAFGSFCFLLLMPFYLIIAILLKIEGLLNSDYKGPIFYKEIRVSKGKHFTVYKFRTVNAKILKVLEEKGGKQSITRYTTNGEYLTPVGRFLARRYLDELPQLFNIVKGDMSLVGPRPHYVPHYENDLKEGIISAKYMKAGLCGWVQAAKGYSRMSKVLKRMAEKHVTRDGGAIFIDKLYLKKYLRASAVEMLFYDIWIIWKCIIVFFRAKGLG